MKPVVEVEADGEDRVMETIIASGPSDGNSKEHVFLVKWKDFTQEENPWETYGNVAEHKMDLLKDFHERNPEMEKDGRYQRKGKRMIKKKSR